MLYIYCIAADQVGVDSVTGVEAAAVELFVRGDLFVYLSRVDSDHVAVTRQNVMQHDVVIRHVLQATTPLPVRFGSLVSEAHLENFLTTRYEALLDRLKAVRNCVEMSVKIIADAPEKSLEEREEDAGGVGTQFLRAKRREIVGDDSVVGLAKEISSWLQTKLASYVRKDALVFRHEVKLLMATSYLVERSHVAAYHEAVKAAAAERPALRFLTSGPWAPYSFVNIDLEFKTHFGVS